MFKEFWASLEKDASQASGGSYIRILDSQGECPLFLGIKQPGMRKSFVIQVPRSISPLPEDIDESKGFDFTVTCYGNEIYPEHISLILSAKSSQYNFVMESMSEALYSKLSTIKESQDLIKVFLKQVKLFQIFFEKQDIDGLSEESQKGLYGELFFLEKYILENQNLDAAILNSWTGPKNRQHDFQFGPLAVEVKTTSSKVHQKLQIASEQQLDESLVDQLYLYYLSVSLIDRHAETLPAIIERIRERLSENINMLSLFDAGLLVRGYLDSHREKYDLTGYSKRDSKFFHIKDEFPRIKEIELRKGVGDVHYSISVAECLSYEITEESFREDLQKVLK